MRTGLCRSPDPAAAAGATESLLSASTASAPDDLGFAQATITGLLESIDITVSEIDLVTKRIVAGFPTVPVRERAFDAIRDAGYTVIPPASG
ncbi:MAG: hypothetical protein ACLQDY_30080 [Streptosporangiaceae bacterium]